VLERENDSEAAITLFGEPFVRLLGNMRRIIVEDGPNNSAAMPEAT
jgi:hypothetical protein